MKHLIKKAAALTLALATLLTLAACGKSGGGETSGNVDAEGRKTLTIGIQQNINVSDYENNYFTQFMEERLNCNIEFVLFDSANATRKTQMNTMLAGGEKLPDILFYCFLSKEDQQYYGEEGVLVDLAPYFDNYETWDLAQKYDWGTKMYEWQKDDPASIDYVLNGMRTPQGNMYAWPALTSSQYLDPQTQMYINREWLDKLGLEMPTNWEELIEVLRAFKSGDPNGNGVADEIPMLGFGTHIYGNIPQWTVNSLGKTYWNENGFFSVTDEGEVYLPYVQDGYREGLRILNSLVDEGLMNSLTFTVTKDEIKSILTPASGVPTVGVMSGHRTVHMDTESSDVFMQYEVLPPFEGSYVGQGVGGSNRYFFITTDCEDFDLAAEFMFQFCGIPEVYYASRYGKEGVDWEYCTDYDTGLQLPYILNDQAYNGINNSTWSVGGPNYNYWDEMTPFQEGDPNPPSDVYDMDAHMLHIREDLTKYYAEAYKNNPMQVQYLPNFTQDEIDENGNIQANLKEFFKEQRALFAVGQLDINDDAVWANYIKTAEGMGMNTLVENAQAAYDRTYNK